MVLAQEDAVLRCSKCQEDIIDDTKYQKWLKLYNFIDHLRLENEITVESYEDLTDALLVFKNFAFEHRQEQESE